MERAQPKRFLRQKKVLEIIPVGKSSLYEMINRGEFPKPTPLGSRSVGWIEDEIIAWQQAQIAKRDGRKAA